MSQHLARAGAKSCCKSGKALPHQQGGSTDTKTEQEETQSRSSSRRPWVWERCFPPRNIHARLSWPSQKVTRTHTPSSSLTDLVNLVALILFCSLKFKTVSKSVPPLDSSCQFLWFCNVKKKVSPLEKSLQTIEETAYAPETVKCMKH